MIRACVGIVISVILQQRRLKEAFLPGAPHQYQRSRHCVRWASVQGANFALWEIDSICRHAQHRETATAPRARKLIVPLVETATTDMGRARNPTPPTHLHHPPHRRVALGGGRRAHYLVRCRKYIGVRYQKYQASCVATFQRRRSQTGNPMTYSYLMRLRTKTSLSGRWPML